MLFLIQIGLPNCLLIKLPRQENGACSSRLGCSQVRWVGFAFGGDQGRRAAGGVQLIARKGSQAKSSDLLTEKLMRLPNLLLSSLLLAASIALPGPVDAGDTTVILEYENDLFAGDDRWYTNGVRATWIRTSRPGRHNDLVKLVGERSRLVDNERSVSYGFSLGQSMYTPEDITDPDPPGDDRPYVTAQSETSYRGAPPVATLVTVEEPVGGKSDGKAGTTGRAGVVVNHPAADGKRPEPGGVLCRRGIVGQQPAELEAQVRS